MALCRFVWVTDFEFASQVIDHKYEIVNVPESSCSPFGKLYFAV